MPSVTLLHRLEPLPHADLVDTPKAVTADPMWLLFRQRQVGELRGTDGGSPVWTHVESHIERLSRFRPGSGQAQPYSPKTTPLEALVERTATDISTLSVRDAVALADALIARVDSALGAGEAYRALWVGTHPVKDLKAEQVAQLPARERAVYRLLAGNAVDGRKLHADVMAGRDLPLRDPSDSAKVSSAVSSWLDSLPQAPQQSWRTDRLEHSFAVAANGMDGETVLEANEYAGGHLDWSSFDIGSGSLGADADPAPATVDHHAIPSPIRLPGMPAPRWWTVEDRAVNWTAMESSLTELGRLLLLEYTLVHGSDWHSVVVPVPVGSLVRLRTVRVTDVFGETLTLQPTAASGPAFKAFDLTGDTHSRVLAAPSLVGDHGYREIEAVRFARDPGANVAWAIERVVPGPTGAPIDRYEDWQRSRPPAPDLRPSQGDRRYVPMTDIPPHWFPLLRTGTSLRRGRVVHRTHAAQALPLGHILNARDPFDIAEAEVPRSGVDVTRSVQRARWLDGTVHQWTGHTKSTSAGEGWSNLEYDTLVG